MLDDCLDDLERRIDPDTEERLYHEWAEFADGRFAGVLFSPCRPRPVPPALEWPAVRVNEACADFDRMALQQFRECSKALETASGGLLCVRCNYGTGILPSLFGAEMFRMADELDTLPTTRPLGELDRVRRVLDAGPPNLYAGLGARVFEMAERFVEIRNRCTRIGRYVHIYHPDTQGPMDVCELLWGSSLFLDIVDRPDLVHALLELVTQTCDRFLSEWYRIVGAGGEHAVHWQLLHRGRIMLRDDSAMNFSPAMFDEFIRPYDQRLLDRFGGGAMHFCGRGDHYIASLSRMAGLHAIAMSQSQCNDIETIFRHTVDRGIALIGLPRAAAEAAQAAGRDLHGRVHCW